MWWNVGRKANSNAARWIDDGWNSAWQIIRLDYFWVLFITGMQGYGIPFHVGHQRFGQGREAHLGIAIGCGCITIFATDITLSLDQGVAHSEGLGESYC